MTSKATKQRFANAYSSFAKSEAPQHPKKAPFWDPKAAENGDKNEVRKKDPTFNRVPLAEIPVFRPQTWFLGVSFIYRYITYNRAMPEQGS